MPYIETYILPQTSILKIYSEKDEVIVDPDYQRNGDIWGLEKRQLLIDSILNEYDIPKIYFHKLSKEERLKKGKEYAIIDGRQRLETIWKFIDGDFTLADDFQYLKDPKIKPGGFTYSDLAKNYPKLKIKFDSISLPIVSITTDDLELIEDMFSRLNEAVPLNSAEKRNAYGGAMSRLISKISLHKFFKENINFSNKRYQHKEAAAKIIFLIHSLTTGKKRIVDTKKIYLDDFVKTHKSTTDKELEYLRKESTSILNEMSNIFIKKDPLLKAQGTLPVYFLLIRDYRSLNKLNKFSRNMLIQFKNNLEKNRKKAETNIRTAEFDLLEYDRLSQQGTNDASSITTRLEILKSYLKL
ncbi:MAG TPA: DUF262 domain-containing protein [Ferruginibacter sp.]|nr:DUF262 domain-containing protein [Ferruginibacter sp.]